MTALLVEGVFKLMFVAIMRKYAELMGETTALFKSARISCRPFKLHLPCPSFSVAFIVQAFVKGERGAEVSRKVLQAGVCRGSEWSCVDHWPGAHAHHCC